MSRPGAADAARLAIELDIAGHEPAGDALGPRAAQQRAHARHQFRHRERLYDIIVGADRRGRARAPPSSPRAVSMMTGSVRVASRARSRRQISMPDTPGSIQSRMTRSGGASSKAQFGVVAALAALDR